MLRDLPNTHAKSEEDEKEMLATPVVFFDTAGCEYFERLDGDGDEGSRCNENEATIVKNWVEQLVCWQLIYPLFMQLTLNIRLKWVSHLTRSLSLLRKSDIT